ARVLLGAEVPLALVTDRAIHVVRLARLSQALVYWYAAEGIDPRVWQSVAEYAELTLFGAETPRPGLGSGVPRQVLWLPALSRALRRSVWQHYTDQLLPEVVADWSLTPAEIDHAARIAPAGPDVVVATCQRLISRASVELFTPLVCPYTWD